jgi:hypothetical protein
VSGYPADWAPGTWRVTGTSLDGGWLPIPAPSAVDSAEHWVSENTAALRDAWTDASEALWSADVEKVVRAMLHGALERRRTEDALAFQIWPASQPLCVFVHVAMGTRMPGDVLPGAGDGILFDAEGLGPGVLVPRTERVGDADVVGYDIVFSFAENVVVVVSVEPTFSDLLGIVSPSIQAFVASLTLVGPDDQPRRTQTPSLLEAQASNTWVDSLSTS